MIRIEKAKGYRICNCCNSGRNVMEITFRNDEVNKGVCVALCQDCRNTLTNMIKGNDKNEKQI